VRQRCVLLIAVCQIVAACSAPSSLRTHSASSAMTYLGRDHRLWLTPPEREHAMCSEGRLLICDKGVGRLSQTWCGCESSRVPDLPGASF
jgi:hypothetical protein